MSTYNYVVTAHKPTNVTHSCVGNFTGPQELNLIIVKCTRIEIHLVTPQGLQSMLDVPIYGRIATLELFRPHGETKDLLFIATERYKYCVLQWDADANEVITRDRVDVSGRIGTTDNRQIGIIDPDCRLIGLHLYGGLFQVFPFNKKGHLDGTYNINISLEGIQVLDSKFLYGCPEPTIAVLYKDYKDARHVETYEVSSKDNALVFVEGPWSRKNLDRGADLLIPVPKPFCGVLIIGEKTIAYCSASAYETIPITQSFTRAYGRVAEDGSGYLLGDHSGLLHLLVIAHDKEKVTFLKIGLLGETSIASTISYLGNARVYVGSSCGNSQLVKLNHNPDPQGSYVEVLETYANLGPIKDFCVVDLEGQGQWQVVTCSGAYKDGSICIAGNGIGINELASLELKGIRGMWSLRSATDDIYDTFLVVGFIRDIRIFAMNSEDELEETEIDGFCSQGQTIFCHDAVHNQLVQVTSSSVRLVNSSTRELRNEWSAPTECSINVATANATQVLLATRGHLFYLEIGDGVLIEKKHAELKYEVSCLDINPIGENPDYSNLAAVGMWTNISVKILSLPDLTLITEEQLGGKIALRSVLLCAFEGITYLLCGLGDGNLLNFVLNTNTGELTDRTEVPLGTKPITLRTFTIKNTRHVFAVSDRPTDIYSSHKKLCYIDVHLNELNQVCPFNTAAFPDCLAIAKDGALTIGTTIGTIFDIFRSIRMPLGEHALHIRHQEQSRTFAICSSKYNTEDSFIHLLDYNFNFLSTYSLDRFESGYSILNCSFSDDNNTYYCVGTAYEKPEENSRKGRILVFMVEDGKLNLVAQKETTGAVYSLNTFFEKLLAGIDGKIELYEWVSRDDGTHELQLECKYEYEGYISARYVQTCWKLIVVGDLSTSIALLAYEPSKGAIKELTCDFYPRWMSDVVILGRNSYNVGIHLGSDTEFNLCLVRRNSEERGNSEQPGQFEVVCEYHLGEFVNRFQRGSLATRPPDPDEAKIPTIIFGTESGMIGVIASLPQDQYAFLEQLQTNLRRVIKGVGGLSHEQWRSVFSDKDSPRFLGGFLDGDLIESFLNLERGSMEEIGISMGVSVEELTQRVEQLTRLH